jgi:hypothetical protein
MITREEIKKVEKLQKLEDQLDLLEKDLISIQLYGVQSYGMDIDRYGDRLNYDYSKYLKIVIKNRIRILKNKINTLKNKED